MLVATGPAPPLTDRWVVEPKLDGWRTLVHVTAKGVTIRTRNGVDISERVPELHGLADAVPAGTVLDGELIAGQGDAESFYGIAGRIAARRPHVVAEARRTVPLTFAAFDLLTLGGVDLCGLALDDRRQRLDGIEFDGPAWSVLPRLDVADVAEALTACEELGLEGVVVKRRRSPYRPGERRPWWVKAKTATWKEFHHPCRGEHEPSAVVALPS